ncbi:MAG: hypothetical protein APG08_00834 [Candidatus Methanofastidiosum methylothiophilum]|jgi:hypothetical protein|uniref:Uncharacterized protein n=1 Tax=Candidatus Methanofastidiosum methylothiophilum TaxID=1705564 RepID=A0A150JCG5_9EURY|nr:MAG: hypothetical protein AN188_00640 [Candidatus Methanofastidiosum methylthiophilus]MBP6932626.1 hypothetical protein [Methanofastidiosum sp.]OQC51682.1 MAG: hypothetical protein BWX56_00839 [Euryarchaeota archaeon ADurb.Bin023]KYC56508.1 MAG: hypothetical protein APG08_00834 [Candidatus Methanofastidiosum methylthiophilus]KYC58106.1 MAG: hypothetical protein APG09_00608 [Candidatus Methanofastidiosum methylthiophilus]
MDKLKALMISVEIPTFTYLLSFIGVSLREIIKGSYPEKMIQLLLINSFLIVLFLVLVYTIGHVGYSKKLENKQKEIDKYPIIYGKKISEKRDRYIR